MTPTVQISWSVKHVVKEAFYLLGLDLESVPNHQLSFSNFMLKCKMTKMDISESIISYLIIN